MSELEPSIERLRERLEAEGWESEETHISLVLLGREEVWKLKKPVSLGFLDFSSLEQRHQACRAEVELNRRLTDDVYLGVEPITRSNGGLRLGGDGEAVEWAVRMRRLPLDRRADRMLAAGVLTHDQIDLTATTLSAFHEACRSDDETARFGGFSVVQRNVRENFRQAPFLLRYLQPAQAAELREWQLGYLSRHRDLLERRAAGGRVRDGHGDLRLDHLYFEGEARDRLSILDCIEFNERFRYADVCADLAFLAMDLAAHGRVDLAELLLARYAEVSDDFDLFALVDFYESYRAFVRGKVLGMMVEAGGAHALAMRNQREARRYFRLALACGERPLLPPHLIAVGGGLATGKTTVARAVGRRLCAPVLGADPTRKAMLGIGAHRHQDDAPFTGAYSVEATESVYRELRRRAGVVLRSGRTAIVDASFRSRAERLSIRELAESLGVPSLFVECRARREVVEERLRRRREPGMTAISDGRLEILDEFSASWEPLGRDEEEWTVRIDTGEARSEHGPGDEIGPLWEHLPRWPDPPPTGDEAH